MTNDDSPAASPSAQLGILKLLGLVEAFDPTRRFKLVRHQEQGLDLQDFPKDWLEAYQAFQEKPVFDGLDFIVSFIGAGRTQARLVGVYEVLGRKPGHAGRLPEGCPHKEWLDSHYFYQMQRLSAFEALEGRVVIEWGKGTRRWHQRPTNKEVVQILPQGQPVAMFDDYLGFTLRYDQLKDLYRRPEVNREWRARLSAVAGVYLILATTTGAQYVGSAHGVEGFWGRWAAYAKDGHGGNKLLSDLVEKDRDYPEKFSYSILQILPPTFARSEVLKWEGLYKQKLGSRSVGLNVN